MLVSPPPHCIGCEFRKKKPSKKPHTKGNKKSNPIPPMGMVVAEINDPRLNKAWKHLKTIVEELYASDLESLYDKVYNLASFGSKHSMEDSEWKVPNDVFDYLMRCEEATRYLKHHLGLEGLYPTNSRLRRMRKSAHNPK